MTRAFESSALDRLNEHLEGVGKSYDLESITPDASNRTYFRVIYAEKSEIACVYPDEFDKSLPQLDVTELFLAAQLPVARINRVDFDRGIVFHGDFGDAILRNQLDTAEEAERESFVDGAIGLIAQIQAATDLAFERNSIASQLRFDQEKLLWELNFYREHFYQSLNNSVLSAHVDSRLTEEFTELAKELETYAEVLTHRDFHAANLMVGESGRLHIIDHQDARIGSAAYDLVSLLLDRITELPDQDWLVEKKRLFMAKRRSVGLPDIEPDKFDLEFDLTAIQRCLKAIGTFSNQAANYGKRHYIQYIDPMFAVVDDACRRLNRFPVIREQINLRGVLSE